MNELNLQYIINSIASDVETPLKYSGIFYRIFSRSKSINSIKRKLNLKQGVYSSNGKKMQDIIGIRIVFYFLEDIDVFCSHLRSLPNFIDESNSYKELEQKGSVDGLEKLTDKVFMPTRLNLIFRMDDFCSRELVNVLKDIDGIDSSLIDCTYEIQLRTVLSEGWHEVEHDLRYKCRTEKWWNYCEVESRMLNGIYATLETSERAMGTIFTSIALKNYKEKDWIAMIRNHLCIRLLDETLPDWMLDLLNSQKELSKGILKSSRSELLSILFKLSFPLKMENLIYLINRLFISNEEIRKKEDLIIKKQLDRIEITN